MALLYWQLLCTLLYFLLCIQNQHLKRSRGSVLLQCIWLYYTSPGMSHGHCLDFHCLLLRTFISLLLSLFEVFCSLYFLAVLLCLLQILRQCLNKCVGACRVSPCAPLWQSCCIFLPMFFSHSFVYSMSNTVAGAETKQC